MNILEQLASYITKDAEKAAKLSKDPRVLSQVSNLAMASSISSPKIINKEMVTTIAPSVASNGIKRVQNLDPSWEVADPANIKKLIASMSSRVHNANPASRILKQINTGLSTRPDIEKVIDEVLSNGYGKWGK